MAQTPVVMTSKSYSLPLNEGLSNSNVPVQERYGSNIIVEVEVRYSHLFRDGKSAISEFVNFHPDEANTLFHILNARDERWTWAKSLGEAFVSRWASKKSAYHHTAYFVSEVLTRRGVRKEPIPRKHVLSLTDTMINYDSGYGNRPLIQSPNLEPR